MSRQNFYKTRRARQRRQVDESLVRHLVIRERAEQPRVGGLKLHRMLGEELAAAGVPLGRDRFFRVLRSQALLLKPLPKKPRTTQSRHSLPVFRNQIKGWKPTKAHQIWISDITYIRTRSGFAYLSLVSDKYSRKILGFHLGEDLETHSTIQALDMALTQLPEGARPIHHSDRGCQYCCHEYVDKLRAHGLHISMTEVDHCAENAQAERVNGILKQEYYLHGEFRDHDQARHVIERSIRLYNTRRPHRSLGLRTPEQAHKDAA